MVQAIVACVGRGLWSTILARKGAAFCKATPDVIRSRADQNVLAITEAITPLPIATSRASLPDRTQ